MRDLKQSEKYKQQSPMVQQDYELHTAHLPVYSAEHYTEGSHPGYTFQTLSSPHLRSKTGQKLLRKDESNRSNIKDDIRRIHEELVMWKNTIDQIENSFVYGTSEINMAESDVQSPLQLDKASSSG